MAGPDMAALHSITSSARASNAAVLHRSPIIFNSAFRGTQPLRSAIDLDLAGDLQILAVEAQDRERVVDHALHEQGLTVAAPDGALAPFSSLGVGNSREVRSIHAENNEQRIVVVEGMRRRPRRSVLRRNGDVVAVVGEGQALDDLADVERTDDARGSAGKVDHIDSVNIARKAALIADDSDIALRADLDGVGREAPGHDAFGVFDLAAVDRQNRNLVVAVA